MYIALIRLDKSQNANHIVLTNQYSAEIETK